MTSKPRRHPFHGLPTITANSLLLAGLTPEDVRRMLREDSDSRFLRTKVPGLGKKSFEYLLIWAGLRPSRVVRQAAVFTCPHCGNRAEVRITAKKLSAVPAA